jgi:transcriptional regulator with XRE-family HTH domain
MAYSQPSLFKERLREACEAKGVTVDKLLRSIGMGSKNVLLVEFAGLRKLDIHRLLQIADRLDVSLDWLMGRSEQRQIQP